MIGISTLTADRFEHPAAGYKKIFETCEELAEPLPATVTGWFAFQALIRRIGQSDSGLNSRPGRPDPFLPEGEPPSLGPWTI